VGTARDLAVAARLWEASERLSGMTFRFDAVRERVEREGAERETLVPAARKRQPEPVRFAMMGRGDPVGEGPDERGV
jgi:hypothetical protein